MSPRAGLLAVAITVLVSGPALATPTEQFELGNRLFEEKLYDSAIAVYLQVVDQGLESASLYFNLGNACFRDGDLGHAILYYLRARRLDPGDPDIVANLDFARRFTSVRMEGVELNPISSLFESIVQPYHLNSLAWLASALFVLMFAFLILRFGLGFRGSVVRAGITLSAALFLAGLLLTTVKYNHDYLTRWAVVIAEVLSETDDYYNVLFENKRRGWIRKDLLAVV